MYKLRFRILAVTFLLATTNVAWSDTLHLASGDRLTGSLLNIRSGLLSFRTELAGRIFVPTDEVTGLNTHGFMLVSMKNNTALPGKIVTKDDVIYVINSSADEKTPLHLANVTNVESVLETPKVEKTAIDENSLNVSLEPGYQWRDGNESNQGATTHIQLDSQNSSFNLNAGLQVEATNGTEHLDHFLKGHVEIQPNTISEITPTVRVNVERNTDKTIEYRSEIAVGGEKTLVNTEKQQLDGFVGLEATIEKFDSDTLRREQGVDPALERTRHDRDLNLNLSLEHHRYISRSSMLSNWLTLHPSLTNPSSIRAEFQSSLDVPLPLGLQLRLLMGIDYDDTLPYDNLDDWSTRFGASVKFEF